MQESNNNRDSGNNQLLLRKALDETIYSLGGPIYKTITWHMNNRGLLSDPRKIDLSAFYLNLRELIGPGADMIIEETWQKLKKDFKGRLDSGSGTPLDRMMRMIGSDEEAA
ncbi:MAG: hypothetical protein ACREBU_04300 [Nitrososphaera sp.]